MSDNIYADLNSKVFTTISSATRSDIYEGVDKFKQLRVRILTSNAGPTILTLDTRERDSGDFSGWVSKEYGGVSDITISAAKSNDYLVDVEGANAFSVNVSTYTAGDIDIAVYGVDTSL